jgi:hypothetical protein
MGWMTYARVSSFPTKFGYGASAVISDGKFDLHFTVRSTRSTLDLVVKLFAPEEVSRLGRAYHHNVLFDGPSTEGTERVIGGQIGYQH